MDIFKIIGVGIVGAVCALVLKHSQSQYAVLATLATGVVILIVTLQSLGNVLVSFREIVDRTGVDDGLFATLLKIVGVGYLTEYSASMCADMDCASIGKKIAFGGKIAIFLMALPIVKSLVEIVLVLI